MNRENVLMLCKKGRKIHIPSVNINTQNAEIMAEYLLFHMNDWDEITINQVHCNRKALKILLTSIATNYQNLKSFAVNSIYFGCFFPSNLFHVVQNLQHLSIENVSIDTKTAIEIMSSISDNHRLSITLKTLNLSGNPVIGEVIQCVEYLAKFIVNAEVLSELYLKSCQISCHDLSIIRKVIENSKNSIIESLEVLDLSDGQQILTIKGTFDLLSILRNCPNIELLNLSYRNIQNDGTSLAFGALWSGLSEITSLQQLDFSCISDETLHLFGYFAKKSSKQMKNIAKLTLKHTLKRKIELYHSLNNILLLCPNLQSINLSNNEMTDKELKIITSTLSNKLPMLRTLILSSNKITAKRGCKLLLNIVYSTRNISKLDINNKIKSIMNSNKYIPKSIAATIIQFTTGYKNYHTFGINEIILFRNNIFDHNHSNVQKLKMILQNHLF